MRAIKRTASLCLASLLLATSLAACGTPAEIPDDQTTVPVADTTAPAETTQPPETGPLDAMKELDFEGASYRIAYPEEAKLTKYEWYIEPEEMTGDILNDTSLDRYRLVEETLNVVFSFHAQANKLTMTPQVAKTLQAGDDAYDLLQIHSSYDNMQSLIQSGLLYNLLTIPELTLDASYFYKDITESFIINEKLYYAVSSFCNSGRLPLHMVFNKKLMEDMNLELPYEAILSGEWTYDLFLQYVQDGYADLNGDGARTSDDRYGYANLSGLSNYMVFGFDVSVVERTENGAYTPALTDEKLVSAIQRIVEFKNSNNDAYNTDVFPAAGEHMFMKGNALFSTTGTGALDLRSIDSFDFGLAPFPKYDENQKHYTNNLVPDPLAIPGTVPAKRISMVGTVTEALAIASEELMLPAYLDVYVERKLLRDPESIEVARLILQDVCVDVSRYYDFAGGIITPVYLLNNLPSPTAVVSYLTSIGRKTAASAEKFFKIFYED